MVEPILFADITHAAERVGLQIISLISAETAQVALKRQREPLRRWQEAGYAADMQYMNRPVELFTELKAFLPNVKTLVIFAAPYSSDLSSPTLSGWGRIARYAWGADYHQVLRDKLEKIALELRLEQGGDGGRRSYRIFTDAVPLLERTLAKAAGIGFIGKNSLVIREGLGSYFFLAELLLTSEVDGALVQQRIFGRELSEPQAHPANRQGGVPRSALRILREAESAVPGVGCGSCESCQSSCPTQAIVQPGLVDARRCISYLTIEKRDAFSLEEGSWLGDWLFGCDICQEVCPFNFQEQATVREFTVEANPPRGGPSLSIAELLAIKDSSAFKARFRASALLRAKREGLLRNAMWVALNQRYFPVIAQMIEIMEYDSSHMLREQSRLVLTGFQAFTDGLDSRSISVALSRNS